VSDTIIKLSGYEFSTTIINVKPMSILITTIVGMTMFQTEPIVYVQSLSTDWLTFFMGAITLMGDPVFYIVVVTIIILGVNFRRGFLLLQFLLLTMMLNDGLKYFFAMPRPGYVDSTIIDPRNGINPDQSQFIHRGANGFFKSLDRDVLEAFRLEQNPSYGFPSGHVSSTTTLWGGMALLFRKHVFVVLTPIMVVLMALSRMYLGRHFLGDVIGGAVLGAAVVFASSQLLTRYSLHERLFDRSSFARVRKLPTIMFFSVMFIIPLFLALIYMINDETVGSILGTNTAFLLILRKGLPDDYGTLSMRVARVLLGLLLVFTAYYVARSLIGLSGMDHETGSTRLFIDSLKTFFPSFILWWGTVTLSFKLGLCKKEHDTRHVQQQ
jgi:membrane-associated phospholipid phosphatase